MTVFVAIIVAAIAAGIDLGPVAGIGVGAALFVLMPYDTRRIVVKVIK